MSKKFKKLRNNLLIFLGIVIVVAAFIIVRNIYTVYDYTHLTPRVDNGPGTVFTALGGTAASDAPDGMETVADNDVLTLYIDPVTTIIAVRDKRNNQIWYSCPEDADEDGIANLYEKDIMRSLVGFRYYDDQRRRYTQWSYANAAANGQFQLESISNGVRVTYNVGNMSLGLDACPTFMTVERFEERVLAQLEDTDVRFIKRMYIDSRKEGMEGFMEMVSGVRTNAINTEKVIRIFEQIGYTLEELEADNEAAGYEMEVNMDFFTVVMEFTLTGDTLTVNLPLSRFVSSGESKLFYIDMMKYFGAGGTDEKGYLFVPSGSGALIEFNNGKVNEETYIGPVYGLDPLMNVWKPQITTPVRLPVLGVKKDNAAALAYIENGAAMATVNADISGKNSSYNAAWFSFLIRDYTMMQLAAGSETDMTVIQPNAYDGDITVNYCFLANEDADYVGMGLAYQRRLVEKGELTPLTQTEHTPFYLDIIGAAEKKEFILGTPYTAMESMTTYEQAGEIADILAAEDVHAVQMRWLGWFNKGINHQVAKSIDWIGVNGSKNDMRALDEQLRADGGGLYPAVNFQLVSYYSKNINKTYEVARDPAGYLGFISSYAREFLNYLGTRHESDFFLLVSPIALPFHVDKFIPAYNKLGMDSIALDDLGSVLTESIYRKDSVDRENSRQIAKEQLSRFDEAYAAVMVAGGNSYALDAATHLVDVPVEMDRHYILDHEVPFYEVVVHGYIDYAGTAVNTREVQDAQYSFLYMLATGAAPHYMWTYQPTRSLEFSPYERYYSTQFNNWLATAAAQYRAYDDIYAPLRTQRITGHVILSESTSFATQVTMTEYENGTKIYVNTMDESYTTEGITVPARGYFIEEGRK